MNSVDHLGVLVFFRDLIDHARLVCLDANLVRAIEKYRKLFTLGGKQVLT